MNWPVAKEPVQKKRRWGNSDEGSDEGSDENFKEMLQIRARFNAIRIFDAYKPANTQAIKKIGESETYWKVRLVDHICGPAESRNTSRCDFNMIKQMSKEIETFPPRTEEVALNIVKPLVDEYAEKVLGSHLRLHLTTRIYFGWRLVVIGLSDTNGMEVILVPERNWAGTRVWQNEVPKEANKSDKAS